MQPQKKTQKQLEEVYPEFNRWSTTSQATTFLAGLQPLIAWVGMIGSFLVVFVFATASWWMGKIDFRKVAVSYAGVSILSCLTRYLPETDTSV